MAGTLTQRGPERTNRLLLIGAVGLAILAAILIFVALKNSGSSDSSGKGGSGNLTVVTAATDIKAGTTITADMLSTTTVGNQIAGAITDKTTAVGLKAVYPIAQGQPLTSSALLGGKGTTAAPSYIIPAGKRAFAVAIQQKTSPSQLLVAGDHVDVIAVGKETLPVPTASGGNTKDFPASITLLQNVEVLAVEDVALKPVSRVDANGTPIASTNADGSIATNPDPTDTQSDAKQVVLAVTPDQAQALAVGVDGYNIYLSLRPPGDDATPLDPSNVVTLPAQILK